MPAGQSSRPSNQDLQRQSDREGGEEVEWEAEVRTITSGPPNSLEASLAELEGVLGPLVTDTVSLFYTYLFLLSCSCMVWNASISLLSLF
jgi:hypothetical protein